MRASRVATAGLSWLAAAAAGWWWHEPRESLAGRGPVAAQTTTAPGQNEAAPSPQSMAGRITAADPMGLKRAADTAAPNAQAAAPGAEAVIWRLAALVARGDERYAVLTAGDRPALKLRAGELLPDGDRIKSIQANRIEILSPRGHLRTLHLIEP